MPPSERANGKVGYDSLAHNLLEVVDEVEDFARWKWIAHHVTPRSPNCEKQYFERLKSACQTRSDSNIV